MRALPDRPTTMTVPVLAAAARLAGALSAHRRGDRHAGCDGRSREQSRNSRARTLPLHSAWIYGQSGSMQVAWSSEEGARWAQRRVLGKTRAMASGGHERRDNRMHGQHGKASVWPA